ncbi:LysR family transcriptional regulator, partial [bacterium]
NCINLRYTADSGWAVWEFEKAGRAVNVRVEGQLLVNSNTLARLGALDGVGLAYLPEEYVEPFVSSGDLVSVLQDWCDPFPGYFLYYPSRRQPSAAFSLVLEALRHRA